MATVTEKDINLVTLEIDGHEVQAPKGSMIIEAADRLGIDIPRFCYHHKLSIAANCRMCLVDVEKAPKPLPACATPVADGMKVFTESKRAVDAQRGVMEFLLINHPLDCPICDQGGECELQDLAMGYGRSISRFTERKRVVKDKNLGPLVATDMTRCIHCTRCVRFLEEIAGTSELGGIGRGEKTEISTFVERNINSELSGNIIDLCPVGALTNKPFRFSARPWEMRARPFVASHDCVGSNQFYHVRSHKIMRSVPRDNEAINECWLADRDRYSHYGLDAADRVTRPKIKTNGQWQDSDWASALQVAADALRATVQEYGADQLGVLVSPRATSQEHFLLGRLLRGLGGENIDHRLRLNDFSHAQAGRAHMDLPSREWPNTDAVFLIGSNIRHDQPILGHRLRTAWRVNGARIMDLNPVAYDCHFDLSQRLIVPPQAMTDTLARVAKAAAELSGVALPDGKWGEYIAARALDAETRAIAETLRGAERGLIVLGDGAVNHPQAGMLRDLAAWLAEAMNVSLCVLPGPGNSEGAWRAGAVPGPQGLSAQAMLGQPRRTYVLVGIDPDLDFARPALARQAFAAADRVIALSAFANEALLVAADVILPLAELPETDGTACNLDGRSQDWQAAIRAPGESREGWKVLRRLGELLGLDGFDFTRLDAVNQALADFQAPSSTRSEAPTAAEAGHRLVRIGDVPIYSGDALVRRSPPLKNTTHADAPVARVHPETAQALGLGSAERVRLSQGAAEIVLPLVVDERIAPAAVWVPSAQPETAALDGAYAAIEIKAA
ncbi:MAG: NADH-quinone oxidoreductase subunit NuoG [Wenzhouxiangella sp.]